MCVCVCVNKSCVPKLGRHARLHQQPHAGAAGLPVHVLNGWDNNGIIICGCCGVWLAQWVGSVFWGEGTDRQTTTNTTTPPPFSHSQKYHHHTVSVRTCPPSPHDPRCPARGAGR